MKIQDIVERIGARVVWPGTNIEAEIGTLYAGDRMSDLLERAGGDTLLVTHLANLQLIRIAELMDVPGICLLDGMKPEAELIRSAREHGTALIVSPAGLEETMDRLRKCLADGKAG